ncbi:hypothetical protein BSZ35_00160 [Salinibacter sp. 10B]|uniref:hypothetical protein n=1 Tax=Salinibacter sp. 10B TaxID=1923971 RepID=UPI000CF564F4|nr:hypothetical protein [Salinibacter sp. 10B]PQJ36802.1 hypothetical protein BSZ35_00160 [Salinibacter sp. 10B]
MTLPNASTLACLGGKAYTRNHHNEHQHVDVVTAANLLVLRALAEGIDTRDLDEIDISCTPSEICLSAFGSEVSVEITKRETELTCPWDGTYDLLGSE